MGRRIPIRIAEGGRHRRRFATNVPDTGRRDRRRHRGARIHQVPDAPPRRPSPQVAERPTGRFGGDGTIPAVDRILHCFPVRPVVLSRVRRRTRDLCSGLHVGSDGDRSHQGLPDRRHRGRRHPCPTCRRQPRWSVGCANGCGCRLVGPSSRGDREEHPREKEGRRTASALSRPGGGVMRVHEAWIQKGTSIVAGEGRIQETWPLPPAGLAAPGERPPVSRSRADRTRSTASATVDPVPLMWPILRPARGSDLP